VRCFCRVEYVGSAYCGWQIQNEKNSIQATLENAFSIATRAACEVVGAGRTDAGVHARGQGMHVDIPDGTPVGRLQVAVNAILPHDIAIYNMQQVPQSFHARYSALSRSYRYSIIHRKMPLLKGKALILSIPMDWDLIAASIPHLRGKHDFSTFCAADFKKENKVCTVLDASLKQKGDCTFFSITADRFIYKMVRSIVGTLIGIGRGKIGTPFEQIMLSKDRRQAGPTALACGLSLEYVTYTEVE
jgi:tRNA pseudouridine38-40 synthase